MRATRVHYTTTAVFAPINQANIACIVKELKELNHHGIKCITWLLPDGQTFMHFDQFENEAAHEVLLSLAFLKNSMKNYGQAD